MGVEALVSLKRDNLPAVGRDRVRLLEAVAREGSISAGARACGITYRAAWDALEAMASVFARPLVETRSGGRDRGGARLTETGARVIAAFRRLEAETNRLARDFDAQLSGAAVLARERFEAPPLRTSARNVLKGQVAAIRARGLSCDVDIALSAETFITARVTNRSVATLGLHIGRDASALIKAPFVSVTAASEATTGVNRLAGVLRRLDALDDQAEALLDLGGGRSLAALDSADAVRSAALVVGAPAVARFAPEHVILAID